MYFFVRLKFFLYIIYDYKYIFLNVFFYLIIIILKNFFVKDIELLIFDLIYFIWNIF